MNMKEYSWVFGPARPIGKTQDKNQFRNVHTDLKTYLYNLQTSDFFHACTYFALKLDFNYNDKHTFSIILDKDKFTITDAESGRALCLEKFSVPACTMDALIICIKVFRDNTDLKEKYNSFIDAVSSAI